MRADRLLTIVGALVALNVAAMAEGRAISE
jgi:hypothetical protein